MPIPGLRRLFELAARPFRGRRAVEAEISFHLEAQVDDLVRRGWTGEAARSEAERRFGNPRDYREALVTIDRRRERRHTRREWWSGLATDLRYVLRGFRQSPAFVAGVGVTLALGIGVNATMIGLVDRLLFKPPAHVEAPDRIVRYTLTQTSEPFGTFTNTSVTWHDFELVRDRAKSIDRRAAYFTGEVSLGRGEGARKVRVTAATPSFFSTLGVKPALGRFFGEDEDPVAGTSPLAVIGDHVWASDFGRSPDVIGKELWLGSERVTIIGVAPKYFTGIDLDRVDEWLPFHTGAKLFVGASGDWRDTWNWQWLKVVGRLAPGATRAQASSEATTNYRAAVATVEDRRNDKGTVTYQPVIAARGADQSMESVVAGLLAGVSVLLLLIISANVTNLVLARGLARRREIAVRLALGIGRRRLVRMLLAESVLLAGLGAVAGLLVAYLGGTVTRRWFLSSIEFAEPTVDLRLVGVTVAVALVTAVLIGLAPAFQISNPDLTVELKAGGPSAQASAGRRHTRTRRGLLLAQGILSVIMLIGAGLFTRSFLRVSSVDFGLRPERVLVAEVDVGVVGYNRARKLAFYDDAYQRFRQVPGLESVSLASINPFWTRASTRVRLPGRDSIPRLKSAGPYYSAITPEYFSTMGIPVKQGRGFSERDGRGGPYVVVVNETLARTFWPGANAVGQCFYVGDSVPQCREVVGVVADANSEELELEPVQAYYVPLTQSEGLNGDRNLFLRTAGDPALMIGTVRRTLQTMARNLPYASVRLLQDQIDPLFRPWRLGAGLLGAMGLIALTVVLVGLYSVLSYAVAQRAREFGIRTALGASAKDVIGLVVAEGQRVIVLGVIVGIGLALVGGRFLGELLFQTSPWDPVVYLVVAAALVAATVLGSLVPAWRAARVEPMSALRAD